MKVTLNRQLIGLEDITFGEGTVEQIRGGQTVEITKINAANLPFDEINTLKEVLDNLNVEAIGSSLPAIDRIYESIDNVDIIGAELLATDNIEALGSDLALGVNSEIRKVVALEPKMDYTKNTLEAKMDYTKNTLEAKMYYTDVTLEPKMDYTKNTLEAKMDYTYGTVEPKMDEVIANLTDINNAVENATLAKNYANAAEDVEVEPGFYSAKHYSEKAKDFISTAMIDDTTISTTTTYSSSKLNTELGKMEGIMLSDTDINTVIVGGRYGVIGTGNTNLPVAGECYLEVLADGTGRVMQMLYYPTGGHYSRVYTTSWSTWFQHNTKSNIGLSNVTNDVQVKAITSTDNAIVRFNGTSGQVQNSGVVIDDSGNISANAVSSNGWFKTADTSTYTGIYFDDTPSGYHSHWINGSEKIRVDSSGNVGIGTSSPDASLVIDNSSASQLSLKKSGLLEGWLYTNGAGFYVASTDFTAFNVNGNERMRIDSAGNVGIGVTPSAWSSLYKVIDLPNGSISGRTDSKETALTTNAYRNTSNVWTYKANGGADLFYQDGGTSRWLTAPSGTAGNTITWTTAMALDANRLKVTSSGSSYGPQLQSNTAFYGSEVYLPFDLGSTQRAFKLASSYADGFSIDMATNDQGYGDNPSALSYTRAVTVKKQTGNLLVGTTTDNGVDKLQVNGSISSGQIAAFGGDLNNLTSKTAFYTITTSATNKPEADSYYAEVIVSATNDWVMQRLTSRGENGTPNKLFQRVRYWGNWSAWSEK